MWQVEKVNKMSVRQRKKQLKHSRDWEEKASSKNKNREDMVQSTILILEDLLLQKDKKQDLNQ